VAAAAATYVRRCSNWPGGVLSVGLTMLA